ncbi:hypothetical protein KAR91_77905 [Candidatus Pacearchaeota archaeon]|nr:hypothetical protein [Candidatus Pacearchaeota archaeon]
MTLYVYRMQDRNGEGPYRMGHYDYNKDRYDWATRKHAKPRHPTGYDDKILGLSFEKLDGMIAKRYKFGFIDEQQAYDWFNCRTERSRLSATGFKMTRVQAAEVICGDKQLIFIEESETNGEQDRSLATPTSYFGVQSRVKQAFI